MTEEVSTEALFAQRDAALFAAANILVAATRKQDRLPDLVRQMYLRYFPRRERVYAELLRGQAHKVHNFLERDGDEVLSDKRQAELMDAALIRYTILNRDEFFLIPADESHPEFVRGDMVFAAAQILVGVGLAQPPLHKSSDPVRKMLLEVFPYAELTYESLLGDAAVRVYRFVERVLADPGFVRLGPEERRIIAAALEQYEIHEQSVYDALIPGMAGITIDDVPVEVALRPKKWGRLNKRLLELGN